MASLAVGVELPAVATKYKFEQFPVPLEKVVKPASPRLDSPEARRYATQLRRGAKAGPNYCGRLSVVEWGCGSCCVEFAVIDLRSGEVFLPGFSVVCATSPLDDPIWASAALYYRADSSLLVVVGAPNEGPERGVYYWRWNGHALVMLGSDHVVKVEE